MGIVARARTAVHATAAACTGSAAYAGVAATTSLSGSIVAVRAINVVHENTVAHTDIVAHASTAVDAGAAAKATVVAAAASATEAGGRRARNPTSLLGAGVWNVYSSMSPFPLEEGRRPCSVAVSPGPGREGATDWSAQDGPMWPQEGLRRPT